MMFFNVVHAVSNNSFLNLKLDTSIWNQSFSAVSDVGSNQSIESVGAISKIAMVGALAGVALLVLSSSKSDDLVQSNNTSSSTDSTTEKSIFNRNVAQWFSVRSVAGRSRTSILDNFKTSYGLSTQDVNWVTTTLAKNNLPTIAMMDAPAIFSNSTQVFSAQTFNKTQVGNINYSGDFGSLHSVHAQQVASAITGKNTGILLNNGQSAVKISHASFDYSQHLPQIIKQSSWASAVVMNNSWGDSKLDSDQERYRQIKSFIEDEKLGKVVSNQNYQNLKTIAQGFSDFSKHGVIVFSNSNDRLNHWNPSTTYDAFYPAYFPKLFGLTETMITVSNYNISDALITTSSNVLNKMLGHHCYLSMEYCVVADGVGVASAYSSSSSDVRTGFSNGNSLGAPQVSAMVYLIAQKFQSNTPKQWRDRLLMTADLSGLPDVKHTIKGTKTFNKIEGGVLQKSMSWLYGLGKPNLGRALNPIGDLKVVFGLDRLWSGNQKNVYSVSQSLVRNHGFSFKSLSSLATQVFVYDDFGYGFKMPLGDFFKDKKEKHLTHLEHVKSSQTQLGRNLTLASQHAFQLGNQHSKPGFLLNYIEDNYQLFYGYQPKQLSTFFHLDALGSLLSSQNQMSVNFHQPSFLKTLGDAHAFGFLKSFQDNGAFHFGWVNDHFGKAANHQSFLFNFSSQKKDLAYNFFFSKTEEENALLDSEFSGGLGFDFKHSAHYLGAGLALELNQWLFSGSFNLGFWKDIKNDRVIQGVRDLSTSEWTLSMNQHQDAQEGFLYFGAKQPRYVETGSMQLLLNTGFSKGDQLSYSNQLINLSPSGRQKNYFLGYKKKLEHNIFATFEFDYIDDFKHQNNQSDWQISFLLSD